MTVGDESGQFDDVGTLERADAVARVLGTSREELLAAAVETHLSAVTDEETFRRRARVAYYRGAVDAETLSVAVGEQEARAIRRRARSVLAAGDSPAPFATEDDPADAPDHIDSR
jgi:hypothetical protein